MMFIFTLDDIFGLLAVGFIVAIVLVAKYENKKDTEDKHEK